MMPSKKGRLRMRHPERDPTTIFAASNKVRYVRRELGAWRIVVEDLLDDPEDTFTVEEAPEQIDGPHIRLVNEPQAGAPGVVESAGLRDESDQANTKKWRFTPEGYDLVVYLLDENEDEEGLTPGFNCSDPECTLERVAWETVGDTQEDEKPYACPECGERHTRAELKEVLERERERKEQEQETQEQEQGQEQGRGQGKSKSNAPAGTGTGGSADD